MGTFKIGDRVRHKTIGEGVVVECHEGHSMCRGGRVSWRSDRWHSDHERGGVDSHYVNEPMDLTLVEPAPPPPDTRKRLREHTDLDNGDTVVIGGVALTMKNNGFHSEFRTCALGYESIADFFVDEVRRKPRTKKRRVYEEIEKAEAMIGDILITDGEIPYVYDGDENDLDGGGIFRFVEETEVPR